MAIGAATLTNATNATNGRVILTCSHQRQIYATRINITDDAKKMESRQWRGRKRVVTEIASRSWSESKRTNERTRYTLETHIARRELDKARVKEGEGERTG